MIAIIDYGAGNLRSVEKAFLKLGFEAHATKNPDTILAAEMVVLPGVGAFGSAMEKLETSGLSQVIHRVVASGKPFLGICLGLQLIFESSEENPGVAGLGILEGKIIRIPKKKGYKIPHIGWNEIKINESCPMFEGIGERPYVYFVHSYYLTAKNKEIVAASVDYSENLEVAVWKGNVFLTQFHPEKSGDVGLKILENWVRSGKGDNISGN